MSSPRELVGRAVEASLDKALDFSRPAVLAHLRRLRRNRPAATPADLLRAVERHYLATVTAGAQGKLAQIEHQEQLSHQPVLLAIPTVLTGGSAAT